MATARLPTPDSDPLGQVLHQLRLTGTLYCHAELSAPWGIAVPDLEGCSVLQIVTAGRGWLQLDGIEPRWMERGSLSFLPRAVPHRISSAPGVPAQPLFELPVEPITDRYERLRHGGGGDKCIATYAVVRFEHPTARRLLEQLPAILHFDPWHDEQSTWLQATAQLAAREAGALRPGGETVLTRLADILVIQCIRAWLDSAPEARTGWLAALRDPQVGRALRSMHAQPSQPWTLGALAQTAQMSRSAFAARFSQQVGQPALRYLTQWRMQLARTELEHSSTAIAEIAARVGYSSEAAFSKAFKRSFGMPPGQARALEAHSHRAHAGPAGARL